MTAGIAELIVRLRGAADRAKDNAVANRLVKAATDLQASVDEFNPTDDVSAGVQRMVGAIAAAQKVYAEATQSVLVPVVTVAEAPAKKVRHRKTDDSPPEAA